MFREKAGEMVQNLRIQAANNPKVSLWSNWVVLEGPKPMVAFQPVT